MIQFNNRTSNNNNEKQNEKTRKNKEREQKILYLSLPYYKPVLTVIQHTSELSSFCFQGSYFYP